MRKIIALFPGQGSQRVGMGKDLCQSSDLARDYFRKADAALGFSLSQVCFEGPAEKLNLTEITQPAILTVSVICFELFRQAQNSGSIEVARSLGHSLGEYSALVAAGAMQFEDAVVLVHRRGRYMQEAVPAGEGKMAAVLGIEVSELEALLAQVSSGTVQIANVNAPGQIVIAGNRAAVDDAIALLKGKRAIELPVSAPFHCALMKPAEERLAADLKSAAISPPAFAVYSNFSAEPQTHPEVIRENLVRQVCGRVRWVECMEAALHAAPGATCVEFGHGNVLTGLLKRIAPQAQKLNVDSLEAASAAWE